MERFSVGYRIQGDEISALERARDICLEQTVEFPPDLVPYGFIQDVVMGQIARIRADRPDSCRVTVSYDLDSTAFELPQLLNILFGNISMKPGIRVENLNLPDSLLSRFKGPRFGINGLRLRLGIKERPLLFTALKPMGLNSRELAGLAYKLARGGIDLIKDDHGLTNQKYAPYAERVARCAEAVARANQETGQSCRYLPNITAPADEIGQRALQARSLGAGGIIVAPGLTGFDSMRLLAENDGIDLPVFAHPAFLGSYVISPASGISHFALFGQIMRLAGADGVIYPNYGGRFSFSQDQCISIVEGCTMEMGPFKEAFPCPGGGMNMENIPQMLEVYGRDVILLVGGGLYRGGNDLEANCRYFRSLVE